MADAGFAVPAGGLDTSFTSSGLADIGDVGAGACTANARASGAAVAASVAPLTNPDANAPIKATASASLTPRGGTDRQVRIGSDVIVGAEAPRQRSAASAGIYVPAQNPDAPAHASSDRPSPYQGRAPSCVQDRPVADLTYVRFTPSRPAKIAFTPREWRHLAGLYGVVAMLHVAGWGLYLYYAGSHPALVGLGFTAYMFGLRHAFDADHIAAIDDTVRFMLQRGQRPLGIGFFFSLGHSTIVLALAVGVAFAATAVRDHLPAWKDFGSLVGAGVSGTFLWIIGIVNLLVLLDILGVWRLARRGQHDHAHLEALLRKRGFLNRIFGGRVERLLKHSWQMYPLGLLFGLGFDTASEVGLLALTAGASAGNLPLGGVLAMPILFAAGMSLMDTSDGVLMAKAYDWAFLNPLRKIFYNITTTSLSVVVALVIGTIELWQVLISLLHLEGPISNAVAGLDFGLLGYAIVGLFLFGWALSVALWKFGRLEAPQLRTVELHRHTHVHAGGAPHAHHHVH